MKEGGKKNPLEDIIEEEDYFQNSFQNIQSSQRYQQDQFMGGPENEEEAFCTPSTGGCFATSEQKSGQFKAPTAFFTNMSGSFRGITSSQKEGFPGEKRNNFF